MMSLKIISAAALAAFAIAGSAGGSVPWFKGETVKIFNSAETFTEIRSKVYAVRDRSGRKLGTLYLEKIDDSQRKMGYGGTVEVAILTDSRDRIAGVLLGKNEETPGFISRLVNAGFLARWNGLTLSEAANRKVDAVTRATYSSEAIKHGVRKLAESESGSAAAGDSPEKIKEEIGRLKQRISGTEQMLKVFAVFRRQLVERKSEELEMRYIALTRGHKQAAEYARGKGMVYFSHPRRGKGITPVEKAAEDWKADPSPEHDRALRNAIQKEYERRVEVYPKHIADREKTLAALKKKLSQLEAQLK